MRVKDHVADADADWEVSAGVIVEEESLETGKKGGRVIYDLTDHRQASNAVISVIIKR